MSRKNDESAYPVVENLERRINRYYLRISRRYMAAGICLMLVMLVYIVGVMLVFGKYVTYDNMKYLARDISAISLPGADGFSSIVYNGGDGMLTQSFRGGLAVCTGDEYLYYDSGGILLVEHDINYATPEMTASDKYMLVYDVGGKGYSVYNQLTCIIEREAEQRIVAGAIADDGSMVLVMRSRETKYVVELYNAAFSNSMSIYKENYVLDAAISPNGEYIVIVSGIPEATDLSLELSICQKGSDSALYTTTYAHTMPLALYAHEEGFTMLCDNGIYFCDYSGSINSSFSFSGMNLRYADLGSKCTSVVGSVNALGSDNRVVTFDKTGEVLYNQVLNERISGVYAPVNTADALAYLKSTDKIIKINSDGASEYYNGSGDGNTMKDSDVVSIVPLAKGALVCSKTSAKGCFTD